MNEIIKIIIVPIINSVLSLILSLYFFSNFTEDKKKRNEYVVLTACIIFTLALMFVNVPLIRLITTSFCTFVFTFRYIMKLYNRIWLTVVFVAISMITEIASSMSIMMVFNTDYSGSLSGLYLVLGSLLAKFLSFYICFIIVRSKHRILTDKPGREWLSLFSLPAATIITICVLHYMLYHIPKDSGMRIVVGVCMLLLVISNLMIFKLVDGLQEAVIMKNRLVLSEQLIKEQSEQYRLLFDTNRSVRKIHHDHRNFLLGVISELNSKKFEAVEKMIQNELSLLDDTSRGNISGNSVLDIILNYKRSYAEQNGIRFNLNHRNVSSLNILSTDLSILLGNTLDNAIEATANVTPCDKRVIDIIIIVMNDNVYITVTNPVIGNIDIENMQTQKQNSASHGFGIISMRTIAEKYKGEVLFECENKMFRTMITLKNNPCNE